VQKLAQLEVFCHGDEIMKMRVVRSHEEVEDLNKNELMVHLAFQATDTDIFKLLQYCPRIRLVQVPFVYRRALPKASEMYLAIQGVELIEGDIWGHRKDTDEYYNIDELVMKRIDRLLNSGADAKDIARAVCRETNLSPELVAYLINHRL
jgi:hypothetical protein